MGSSDFLSGLEMLSGGMKDYAAGETTKYNRVVEAANKASNKKLGTEILQDSVASADPKTKYAARALQEGTLTAEQAMSGFRDLSPEQQLMMLSAQAIQTNDPALQKTVGDMMDYYGKIHQSKAYFESYGKTTGYLAGGGSFGGGGGGGGAGGGTAQLSNMVVSKAGLMTPILNKLNTMGLKYKDGKAMTFTETDVPANMIARASPEDAQTLTQALVSVTRGQLSQRTEFSNPMTSNVLDAASVKIAQEVFGSGFDIAFKGAKKEVGSGRNKSIEYGGASDPSFPIDSRILYHVNTPAFIGGGQAPSTFGQKPSTPVADSLYNSFNDNVLSPTPEPVKLPKKVKMSASPFNKEY